MRSSYVAKSHLLRITSVLSLVARNIVHLHRMPTLNWTLVLVLLRTEHAQHSNLRSWIESQAIHATGFGFALNCRNSQSDDSAKKNINMDKMLFIEVLTENLNIQSLPIRYLNLDLLNELCESHWNLRHKNQFLS